MLNQASWHVPLTMVPRPWRTVASSSNWSKPSARPSRTFTKPLVRSSTLFYRPAWQCLLRLHAGINVPRSRFLPVKKTSDLLLVRW